MQVSNPFSILDIGQELQGEQEAEPVGFIFLQKSQLIRIRFSVVLKEFELNNWFC